MFCAADSAGNRTFLLTAVQADIAQTFDTSNMADDDVATKAPESDAQETSGISSEDTPAQKGVSMGEHCVTDRPSREPATIIQPIHPFLLKTHTATGDQQPSGVGLQPV